MKKDDILYIERITYEDCGLLGGRTLLNSGMEYQLLDDSSETDLIVSLLFEARKRYRSGQCIYPCKRLAICSILWDMRIPVVFFDGKEEDDETASIIHNLNKKNQSDFDYKEIGTFFAARNIQQYEILQQTDVDTFEVIGYKTPKSADKYGHAYDVFRCLDVFGTCNMKMVEKNDAFHQYIRYDLGEDFYIEAYDNETTQSREFWLGRHFMNQKLWITAFDFDDTNYLGLFDEKGHLIVDQDIAEKICSLTDPHEYIFIDNDYNLSMKGLRMDGDE